MIGVGAAEKVGLEHLRKGGWCTSVGVGGYSTIAGGGGTVFKGGGGNYHIGLALLGLQSLAHPKSDAVGKHETWVQILLTQVEKKRKCVVI